jgi:hypothetical protein
VLLDGNPASIEAIRAKIATGLLPPHTECVSSDILHYAGDGSFDIVLCEGVLPGQNEPEAFLSHVASFAAPAGLLVVTTMSPVSLLAEACRRALKPLLVPAQAAPGAVVERLTAFFAPDLNSLPGMNRLHEDWVLDNILHPWPERFAFSISEAIDTLGDSWEVIGTSPHFIQDWRWYKAIANDPEVGGELVKREYDRWSLFFLDYRLDPRSGQTTSIPELAPVCHYIFNIHTRIWHGDLSLYPDLARSLSHVADLVEGAAPETALAIHDFLSGLAQSLDGNSRPEFGAFRRWFGRGQQYVSFTRQ